MNLGRSAGDRLSGIEAAYLDAERPGFPVHVGAVATFEAGPLLDRGGELRLDVLRSHLTARLDRVPRLRRRIAAIPFGLDRPRWIDDVDFDLANHLDVVEAPAPGDDDALRHVAADTWSAALDRAHPLWQLRFVTGLDGDRVGLVERVHHALADGASGVDLASVLLDLTPEPQTAPASTWTPAPPTAPAVLVADGVQRRVRDLARAARSTASLVRPSTAWQQARALAAVLGALGGEGTAPRSSLNRHVGTARRLAWVRTNLDDVKAAGAAGGATVNDVTLSAVAGGLRSLLLSRGEPIAPEATLRVLVPVSVRHADEHGALGNRVSALSLPLPIGIGDPHLRLRAVSEATERLKGGHDVAAAEALLAAADLLPPWLLRFAAPAAHRQPLFNLIVTNVPGPPVPLYLLGARMLEAFPIVPLVGNLSVNVAVLSYDGALNLGLTADVDTCGDLDVLVDGIEQSFATLTARAPVPAKRAGEA